MYGGMELRHLRYFTTVAEVLSFSEAARRLHIAQPPLSAQIRTLENELGIRLFDRTSRGVGLTQAGAAFLPRAREALAAARRASDTGRAIAAGRQDGLRLGIIPPALTRGIAERLRRFHAAHPGVALHVRQEGASVLHELVLEHDLDAAITRPFRSLPALREKLIEQHELMLALPAAHPWARRRSISWKALDGVRTLLINPARNAHYGQLFLQHCSRHNARPVVEYAADDLSTLIWMVSAGLGVCPYPSSLVETLPPGTVCVPFSPHRREMDLVLLWRSEATAAPALESFLAEF
jgi:DNA-binding transcriptional LysR family regulator